MAAKSLLACFLVSAAVAFLLFFASSGQVSATTYKITYGTSLSCAGPNGTYESGAGPLTGDDSCVEDPTYGAYGAGLTADMSTHTTIADGDSYWYALDAFGLPVTWGLARGEDLPMGAYVGDVISQTTLSLANAPCPAAPNVTVTIPMFNCSTDNSAGNQIVWEGDGSSLAADADGNGLPEGCDQYPDFVDNMLNGLKPRARYFGYTVAVAGSPPTYLQFVMLHTEQISNMETTGPEPDNPEDYMGDALGYADYMILANPTAPATPSTISELCTPMDVDLPLYGLTAGRGEAIPTVGNPELTNFCTGVKIGSDDDGDTVADDGCFVAQDLCGDSTDNDGDTVVDEMCGLVRTTNPAANSGIYGTGTHLSGTYSESYRDYDGDGFDNNHDSCPYTVGVADDDFGCDGCAGGACPAGQCNPLDSDCDNDGFDNRQDNCPFDVDDESVAGKCAGDGFPDDDDEDGVADDGCPGGPLALLSSDADRDGIGKLCDEDKDTGPVVPPAGDLEADGPFVNDFPMGAVCIGEADTDGDGWCDATETALGSDPNDGGPPHKTPEHYGIDFSITAAETPPGNAPGSCSNQTYYDTAGAGGAAVDDDGDTLINVLDILGCTCEAPDEVNDGCTQVGAVAESGGQCTNALDDDEATDPETGAECDNNTDDDYDGRVNDGCPQVDAVAESGAQCDNAKDDLEEATDPETGAECDNSTDDDGDTAVNDGCPKSATNDDYADDTVINDGCPADGPAETGDDCLDDVDDDGDTTVNDGCAQVGATAESGAQCTDAESGAQCANSSDDDGDTLVNDGCPAVGDGAINDGCPTLGDGAINDGCPEVNNLSETGAECNNHLDDDADADCDGVLDLRNSDNCAAPPVWASVANPEQLDSDGDGLGDACDTDDDDDGMPEAGEWVLGCDPKGVGSCGYNAFDLNGDGIINVLDVNLFGPPIYGVKPGTP